MWGVTLEREPEVLGGLGFPGPGEKKQQVFGLCAECCALLSLGNESIQYKHWTTESNWFADHLYRRDFWSFATDLPVLPQNNMLGENHFQLWEVGYSHHSLAALPLHGGSVVLFQGFYQPSPLLHLSSSLININTTCFRTTWQFQTCQDEKEMSAKPCERTGLDNFQNVQILLPSQWRRKCTVLFSCVKGAR